MVININLLAVWELSVWESHFFILMNIFILNVEKGVSFSLLISGLYCWESHTHTQIRNLAYVLFYHWRIVQSLNQSSTNTMSFPSPHGYSSAPIWAASVVTQICACLWNCFATSTSRFDNYGGFQKICFYLAPPYCSCRKNLS